MNDPRLEILVWPEELSHVPAHLEQGAHQDFHEMQMEDGFVSRRPATTPIPVFKGTVSLSQAQKAVLKGIYRR